ncbi:hypothetical protein BVRB_024340, partial [Beta vulgaris subsp. vulgaris]
LLLICLLAAISSATKTLAPIKIVLTEGSSLSPMTSMSEPDTPTPLVSRVSLMSSSIRTSTATLESDRLVYGENPNIMAEYIPIGHCELAERHLKQLCDDVISLIQSDDRGLTPEAPADVLEMFSFLHSK